MQLFCKEQFMKSTLLFALLVLFGISAKAQNVTISPATGKLIAGLTYSTEVGFQNGWSSMWRHEQLPLTLTVSDKTDLTEGGLLKDPAGNISVDKNQNLFVVMGGTTPTTRMSVSLPKGYRFTGYRMVLLNNVNGKKVNNMTISSVRKRMYETTSNFSTVLTSSPEMGSSNESKEYVIERTSMSETDMGNNLYFNFWRASDSYYGVTIKSFELFFTAEGPFTAAVAPTATSGAVNMIGAPFNTNKLDLGTIKPNTKNGNTYYSYDYNNVTELKASNVLYQEDAVTAGSLPATADAGTIQAVNSNGQFFYALGNNTYYVETPTTAKTQNNTYAPVSYRITGARVNYSTATPTQATGFYIQATDGKYLQTNLTWSDNPTSWEMTNAGKIHSGSTYLRATVSGTTRRLNTGNSGNASTFAIDAQNRITFDGTLGTYYIISGTIAMSRESDNAAHWTAPASSAPSSYTLKVYSTDKNTPLRTVEVPVDGQGSVVLTDLNNDAVKFSIEGLEDDAKAFVTFELTMEALNPYVNTMDATCHSKQFDDISIYQQFTSNDFNFAGGRFVFYVPSEFMGDEEKCRFTFDNLYSKYGDETYTDGNGHSRYFFAKSPYYEAYGDGKQYTTTGTESSADKVHTNMCGNKPFYYSNIDKLSNTNTGASATTLEEYPYFEAAYTAQDGTFFSDVEIAVNENRECYLFVADETRWNVAPTTAMEHRFFAYYLLDIELQIKDYDAVCELTKVYDTTCYAENGADADKAMYGAKFKAIDKATGEEVPATMAYLTSGMMKSSLEKAINENGLAKNQILYLDFTGLYSVQIPAAAEMDAFKNSLNPNCLVYFPQTVNFNGDNYATKTASGDYRACRNIVITDKNPFFAPYKITVPAENYATYTREITIPKNGKVTSASIILPFTLAVEDGVHTNKDGLCTFAVNKMNATDALDMNANGLTEEYTAYFSPIEENVAEANKPYVVEVIEAPEDQNISFVATQYGSDVVATAPEMADDYTFAGEATNGSVIIDGETSNYSFAHFGSFSGEKLAKAEDVFYFAKNQFVSSETLIRPYVYVYPFRCYYKANAPVARGIASFMVEYGENPNPTGIDSVVSNSEIDLAVIVGDGTITVQAAKDQDVTISGLNGMSVARLGMQAGQTETVNVPAGIYVVKGKKVIVK